MAIKSSPNLYWYTVGVHVVALFVCPPSNVIYRDLKFGGDVQMFGGMHESHARIACVNRMLRMRESQVYIKNKNNRIKYTELGGVVSQLGGGARV